MNLLKSLEDSKAQIASLSEKAALHDALATKAAEQAEEITKLNGHINTQATLIEEKTKAVDESLSTIEALKAEIVALKDNQKAADEVALDIVASLGMKEAPKVEAVTTAKTAEDLRKEFMAMTDPNEKGKFYAEHKNALLNGFID